MTLSEYANFICSKVGQMDDYSKGLCKGFLQARYRMIWDAELWRDSQQVTSASATAATVAFPADTQRIISIRCGSAFVDPVDATFIVETDPTLFEATGQPKYYEDFTNPGDGVHSLRLFPHPTGGAPAALIIVAKRPCPTLADGDTPALRNVDNALLAFATGDMLERQRHYAKAQAKFQEAATHLDWMRKVESEQADRQRQNKTLSANGHTLGDLVDDVASRLGAFDPAARIRIKQSIRRAYEAIWDAYLWRETLAQATATVTGGVATLPAEIERPISVRYGAAAVEAVETELLFDVDPASFEATGAATSFTEQRDADGTLKIILRPAPPTATVLILGKRKLVPLNAETDAPLLRNVANALISMAVADLMSRLPGANPQTTVDERAAGMAAVEAMKNLQDEQSMRRRRARALYVAGNSLAEMVDAVLARCGVWDIENMILAKEFLRRQYQAIWDSRPWKESHVLTQVQTDGQTVILPEYVDRVISVRTDDKRTLLPVGLSHLFSVDPAIFERQGAPIAFSILTSVGVRVLPLAEQMSFVSSDASDRASLFIRGEAAGMEGSEMIVLNGTTPVQTGAAYDTPLTVAKPITAGVVTVTGVTSEAALLTLLAVERERKHIRLWLHPAAPECPCTGAYLVLGKRRIHPLVNDQDTPMLRDIADALIHAAAGDMFTRVGKPDLAADARAQAAAALKTLVSLETDQAANIVQIVPYAPPQYAWSGYDDGAWMR